MAHDPGLPVIPEVNGLKNGSFDTDPHKVPSGKLTKVGGFFSWLI